MGHVGDGNFHVIFLIDPKYPEEQNIARQINHRMISHVIAMGGTCSGEHGIGIGKKDYLDTEFGEALGIMHDIKHTLDPCNIMNPGKVLDSDYCNI